jgi:AcrR family transcriptional regulator
VSDATRSRRPPAGAAVLQPDKTEAIVAAVFEELAASGYRGLSMDKVAARAGVGKAALYRRWSAKQEMLVDVVGRVGSRTVVAPDTGSLRGDVRAIIDDALALIQDPVVGRVISDLIAEARRTPQLAEELLVRYREPRRATGVAMLERAVERGEIPPDVDVDIAIDTLIGPLYLRALIVGDTLDADYAERLVDAWMRVVRAGHHEPMGG